MQLHSAEAVVSLPGEVRSVLQAERSAEDWERDNLRTLFMQIPAAMAILRGPEFRYVLSNARNQELLDNQPVIGRTVKEVLPALEADGVVALLEQVYRTGEPCIVKEYPVSAPAHLDRPDGRMHMTGVLQALRAPDGSVDGVMMFSYEVTEQVMDRERLTKAIASERSAREEVQFLGDASRILSSSLDYRVTLSQIARIAVPRLADWCVIELLSEDGNTQELAITHSDPSKQALAIQLRKRFAVDTRVSSDVANVIESGVPHVTPEISDEMLVSAARDEEHLRVLREIGLCSSILVPLSIGDRAIGALGLYQAESGRKYTQADIVFTQELGRRAALAIENARLFEASQAAIRMRDDFLSIASHELKTPVTSLRLYLDALSRDAERGEGKGQLDSKLMSRISKANRQVERLTVLIAELLDVSRMGRGKLELARRPMDLAQLAREVVDGFAEQSRALATELSVDADAPVLGHWDRDRLDQVITNLLTNALKHAPGRPAQVRVEQRDGLAILTVEDHGPGIDPEDQPRIFGRFERAQRSRNIGGFGLGLWIVREIVAAHSGYVRVESVPSKGSRFIVQLPISREVVNDT